MTRNEQLKVAAIIQDLYHIAGTLDGTEETFFPEVWTEYGQRNLPGTFRLLAEYFRNLMIIYEHGYMGGVPYLSKRFESEMVKYAANLKRNAKDIAVDFGVDARTGEIKRPRGK